MRKRVAILGSTGSIGTNALRVLESLPDEFEVAAIAANTNYELLWEQAERFSPDYVGIVDKAACADFRKLPPVKGELVCGEKLLWDFPALDDIDIVIVSVVGFAGLTAVMSAVEAGKRVAIANKEPLVAAGPLIMKLAKRTGAEILPIDSEHSALFQCLHGGAEDEVENLILTASGGPFHTYSPEQLQSVTIEEALAHPRWKMGPKITVDSATMMNKALEVLEAVSLFEMEADKIKVLIHPEAAVHSMVEYVDGSILAQISEPDMRLPIQYALTYPRRLPCLSRRISLADHGTLTFKRPDPVLFPALRICYEVAEAGGLYPAVLNAANEAAVEMFLNGKIKFTDIMKLVEKTLEAVDVSGMVSTDTIIASDGLAREYVYGLVE
jgi:1-deoxy-D-xylulose-5-phosphate reductoisomerase